VRQALQWLVELRAEHRVVTPSQVVAGSSPLSFENGSEAMYWQGLWNVRAARSTLKDNWDVVPLPQFRGAQRVGFGQRGSGELQESGWRLAIRQVPCLARDASDHDARRQRSADAQIAGKPLPELMASDRFMLKRVK
jgi:hypothetical protein